MASDNNQSSIVRFGRVLAAVALIFTAPVSGYFFARMFLDARASANWPFVDGSLTKAEVGTTSVGRYFPDVAYSYRVGDRDFVGSTVRFSDGEYRDRNAAAQAISGLSVAQSVKVFYDPADPSRTVLQTGAGFQEYALLCIPLIMLGIGVLLIVHLWRTRQRR